MVVLCECGFKDVLLLTNKIYLVRQGHDKVLSAIRVYFYLHVAKQKTEHELHALHKLQSSFLLNTQHYMLQICCVFADKMTEP